MGDDNRHKLDPPGLELTTFGLLARDFTNELSGRVYMTENFLKQFGLVYIWFNARFQQCFSYIQVGSLPNHRSWVETSTRHQPLPETTNCLT